MADHAHSASAWNSHASKWSSQIQSITLSPCTALLSSVDKRVPLYSSDRVTLDNGAGAGMLTTLLKRRDPDSSIVATDISPGMIEGLSQTIKHEAWSNVTTHVLDAQDLSKLSAGSFSHVLSTFVLNFMASPETACREMYRVARPGGVIGLATWSRVSWVPVWERAVQTLRPEYKAPL